MISMTWPQYLRRECRVGDFVVRLAATEAEVLLVLLLRYPEPVPICDLVEALYPDPDREPDTAEALVAQVIVRLRHKLGSFRIFSRKGFGFRLCQRQAETKAWGGLARRRAA